MNPLFLIIIIFILFFSVIIHECSHGYAALLCGDDTAKVMGRLTLNPIPHIDPIGTLLLPFLLVIFHSRVIFAWAKPVPINPYNFYDYKKGILLTGAAGPLSNIILSLLFSLLFRVSGSFSLLSRVLALGCLINLFLAIFNLIPVPPLDGSRIISGLLPSEMEARYRRIEPFGTFIILFLFLFGALDIVFSLGAFLSSKFLGISINQLIAFLSF